MKVYAVIHNFRDLESHRELEGIYENQLDAYKQALKLVGEFSLGEYEVIAYDTKTGKKIEEEE